MKVQINRFSPHQTAKVFAILVFVSVLLFVVPLALLIPLLPEMVDPQGNPVDLGMSYGMSFAMMAIVMPIVQAVFAYLVVLPGCWIYNIVCARIGGIEFEFVDTGIEVSGTGSREI